MKKAWFPALAALVLALGAGWYFGSPSWTLSQMRSAAKAGDGEKLSSYIDFPAMRESLKGHLKAQLAKVIMKKTGNPFETLGLSMAMTMVDGMVDGLITPETFQASFAGKVDVQDKRSLGMNAIDGRIERTDFDHFKLVTLSEGKDQGSINFTRHGLGWKASGLTIPTLLEPSSSKSD